MDDHSRVDAVGSRADQREAGAEDDQDRQPLEQSVREPERDADPEDGGVAAERLEQRVAEPAEGELLDDRRDDDEDDEVDGVRASRGSSPSRRA